MTLKKNTLLNLVICFFPAIFQVSNITGNTVFNYMIYILTLCVYYFDGRWRNINKTVFICCLCVFFSYFLVPLASGNSQMQTVLYCAFMILFLLDTYICGKQLCNSDNERFLLVGWLFSNTIPLLYQLFCNRKGYSYSAFMTVFSGVRQGRSYFGYSHPNFAGMFLVMEVVLLYMAVMKAEKKPPKIFLFWGIIFTIFTICMTGSRTSLYCSVLFLVIELSFKFIGVFKKWRKFVYPLFIVFFLAACIMAFGDSIIENSSGRLNLLQSNYRVLLEEGNLLLGTGGLSVSSDKSNISHSDNWFMTAIINTGLVGFAVTITMILQLFITVSRKHISNSLNSTVTSMCLVIIIYSCAENMLFVPGVGISWLVWSLVMSKLLYYEYPVERLEA